MIKRKKGFEFSFAWIFAVLVGAVILFLAIYATIKIIKTGEYQINTVTAKQLSIIFEPMETGLASGKSSIARLREETRIYNECEEEGSFGKQTFSLAGKIFAGKWSKPAPEGGIPVTNKYIFSDEIEEGKTIYFFSKPFEMPFKVSEIIFLSSKNYCFVDAPEEIKDEVSGLNLGNIKVENCTSKEIKVCFQGNCEIKVTGLCKEEDCESEYDYGYIEKNGKNVFYTSSLLYAGIFASKDIYECNVKRLMKRLVQEATIYKNEIEFLAGKCGDSGISLIQLSNTANLLKKSEDLALVSQIAKQADEENDKARCELW